MRGDTGADLWQKIRLRADRIDKIDKTIKELQDKVYFTLRNGRTFSRIRTFEQRK